MARVQSMRARSHSNNIEITMKTLPVILGLLFAGSVGSIQAQTPGAQPPAPAGEVTGTIIADDNAAPVARPAVAVRNAKDSSMVTGAMGGE
ncbi:MAG: hypothetical protein ACXW2A_19245, partial [Burkholderiales bacterium]